jgi:hypothetical protein
MIAITLNVDREAVGKPSPYPSKMAGARFLAEDHRAAAADLGRSKARTRKSCFPVN